MDSSVAWTWPISVTEDGLIETSQTEVQSEKNNAKKIFKSKNCTTISKHITCNLIPERKVRMKQKEHLK